jgi:hypothetical protein
VHASYDGPVIEVIGPEVGLSTTILRGRLKRMATSPDNILFGKIPLENTSERERVLRELEGIKKGRRSDQGADIRVRRGSSIGSLDNDDRGSAAVYLQSATSGATKLLTAAHVVIPHRRLTPDHLAIIPDLDVIPEHIFSPGNIDIRKHFASLDKNAIGRLSEDTQKWVQAYRRKIGTSRMYAIGVGTNGFRSDWALIDLDDGISGANGEWWGRGEREVEILLTREGVPETEVEKFNGQTTSIKDPKADDGYIWLKDGSTSGWTSGRCVNIVTEWFLKSWAISANPPSTDGPPEIPPSNLITAKVMRFVGNNGEFFADGGDSGATVLGVKAEDVAAGMAFGGLVVSASTEDKNTIYVVPASKVLEQIKEATGEDWDLA